MFSKIFALCFVLGADFSFGQIDPIPRKLGEVQFSNPAFLEVYQTNPEAADYADRYTLFISTFNPITIFFTDPVYKVEAPGKVFRNAAQFSAAVEEIDSENYWPNNPDLLPADVVGRPGIIWTSGFLVPGKGYGALNVYYTDGTLDGPYNMVENDARGTTTEFVWLENPGDGSVTNWAEHPISSAGPDVHFRHTILTSGDSTYDVFIVGEFFAETLTVFYALNNDWSSANNIQRQVIDQPGQIFDLYLEDFNLDGSEDLLITAYDGEQGFVYVYQIPQDFINEDWARHTAADGFTANFILLGQSMTPGSPRPFYPSAEIANKRGPDGRALKKWILLSGDDDGKLYVLTPNSEGVDDFSYTKNILVDTGATTSGKFAVLDMDGDGYTDIVAAGYSAGKLYLFTYGPE